MLAVLNVSFIDSASQCLPCQLWASPRDTDLLQGGKQTESPQPARIAASAGSGPERRPWKGASSSEMLGKGSLETGF